MAVFNYALTINYIKNVIESDDVRKVAISLARKLISEGGRDSTIEAVMADLNTTAGFLQEVLTAYPTLTDDWLGDGEVDSLQLVAAPGTEEAGAVFFKVDALPDAEFIEPNAIYLHPAVPGSTDLVVTVTGKNREILSTPSTDDFDKGGVKVFETYEAMIAFVPEKSVVALVINATGDPVVETGSASYIYNADDEDNDGIDEREWILTGEHDTINVEVSWNGLIDNPWTEDSDGRPEYNGMPLPTMDDLSELAHEVTTFRINQW